MQRARTRDASASNIAIGHGGASNPILRDDLWIALHVEGHWGHGAQQRTHRGLHGPRLHWHAHSRELVSVHHHRLSRVSCRAGNHERLGSPQVRLICPVRKGRLRVLHGAGYRWLRIPYEVGYCRLRKLHIALGHHGRRSTIVDRHLSCGHSQLVRHISIVIHHHIYWCFCGKYLLLVYLKF
jgi:hypothetical protein